MSRPKISPSVQELLQLTDVTKPPVPVERIARLAGVQLRYEPFEGDISGLIYQEHERTIIGVNSFHPETRQRFTIAHELGHLKLHSGEIFHVDRGFPVYRRDGVSSQATDEKEIRANQFAAELLMPSNIVINDWKARESTFDYDYENDGFIRGLAKRYKVSSQAMIFRLINLGLIIPQNY